VVKKHSVFWTQEAINDLKLIYDYISGSESCQRALYVVTGIRKEANETAKFPTKHTKEPYINRENIRFAIKWSYKIVFEIKGNSIRILSIFHTAQSPEKLIEFLSTSFV